RIVRVLEFNKIIAELTGHAETSLGKELTQKLKPKTELSEVSQLQEETEEAVQIIRLNKMIPLGGIRDIRPSLKRSSIGGSLAALECLDVANTIYGGRQVKTFLTGLEEDLPILKDLA